MEFKLTNHAITRWHERVQPALLRADAEQRLKSLLRSFAKDDLITFEHAQDWMKDTSWWREVQDWNVPKGFIEIADGIVGTIQANDNGDLVITTVLVRGGKNNRQKKAKKRRREAKRTYDRTNRLKTIGKSTRSEYRQRQLRNDDWIEGIAS